MSDLMIKAVLSMPFEMAMESEMSRAQFYDRAQQAMDALDLARSMADENLRLKVEIEELRVDFELATRLGDAIFAELDKKQAEIERLRAENDQIKQTYPEGYEWLIQTNAKIVKLQAVVDALLKAKSAQKMYEGIESLTEWQKVESALTAWRGEK